MPKGSTRIDDPKVGWKRRGLRSPSGDRMPWLNEFGKRAPARGAHPGPADPLAK